jgi:CHRD domain
VPVSRWSRRRRSPPVAAETVTVQLRGFEEVPSNASAATGSLRLFINDRAGTVDYELSFDGLEGDVTQAHIHVGQAGVAGGISIWLCQTATNPAPPPSPH